MKRVLGGVVHQLPVDLRDALLANATALAAWNDITPLARNEFICWVEDAKQKQTRTRRIRRAQEELEEGMRQPCCWPGVATANARANSQRVFTPDFGVTTIACVRRGTRRALRQRFMRTLGILLLLATSACTGATYHANAVGYEVHSPPAFLSANSHEEFHMDQTNVGVPLDVAATYFGAARDPFFGGGETYIALGVHGPFQLALDDATIGALEQGLSDGFAKSGLGVTAKEKLATTPLAVGEEVTFAPTSNEGLQRTVHARVFVAEHSVFFVFHAVDSDQANKRVFVDRRKAFFDGFHVTTPPAGNGGALQGAQVVTMGRFVGNVLVKR